MSHFTVLCLLPEPPEDLDTAIARMLEPFNEALEVPRYRTKCWCVGDNAENDVRTLYTKKAVEDARATFKEPDYDKKEHPIFPPKHVQQAWEEHLAPIFAEEKRLLAGHALFEKPDPECDDCKGKGKVWSTSNPKGYWDWWVIGGRWDNILNGKNDCPLKDMIDEIVGFKDEVGKPNNFSFALCADGEWYAAGKMLMFASVKDQDYDFGVEYIRLCKNYLTKHPHAHCVMVDCHV